MNALSREAVLEGLRELPAVPAVVLEVIRCMDRPDVNAGELAKKLSYDQALAAKTLRLANSSFYGLQRQVGSVAEAATILGLRALRSIVVTTGFIGAFPATACPDFDSQAFWRHSVATALCARSLAKVRGLDEDTAFTLGLLHDIGRLLLVTRFTDQYAQVLAWQKAHDCPALEAEQALLGIDHAVVGGMIAESWQFSPAIVQAISKHHEPPVQAGISLIDVVHVADNIAHALDLCNQSDDIVPPLLIRSWSMLALNESACIEVFREVEEEHKAVCDSLFT